MTVEIKDLGKLRFVGIRVEFSNANQSVREAVEQLKNRRNEIKNITEPNTIYGITTFQIHYVTDPNNLVYYVCYKVNEFEEIRNGLEPIVLPPHQYARIDYVGPMSNCQTAYSTLDSWVNENGFAQDKEACNIDVYEQQHHWSEPDRSDNVLTIYKAINKKRISGLACINIPVRNVDVSASWYVENLGVILQREPTRFEQNANAIIQFGEDGPSVLMHEEKERTPLHFMRDGKPAPIFELRTDDADAFYKQLLEKGVTVSNRYDNLPCGKYFHVHDPDGNVITIVE
ncbi:GyrI-like domain-containing protein [Paenibacillus thermotolerans]|uniref:GyrI-like domain-containing protein n=1 Tax=Paenibacillus thermotolerans TaxID=3027807 RepID=UPI002368E1E3|nr:MULTISPECIES: GyrI-like domain-containing protein [unclassified Paenibacillus]